jgi:predicted transcriptional regulator
MKDFTLKEQRILNEIERRLRYFKDNNIESKLLLLEIPSQVKTLVNKGYITPSRGNEIKYNLNWYMLTEKGKQLFNKIKLSKIDENLNQSMFEGKLIRDYNKIVT